MPITDRFLVCIPFTLAQECPLPNDWPSTKNFSHDRHDPGGATQCGIIQREFDIWRKGHREPTCSVAECSKSEGYAIYNQCYWLPHCPLLAPGVDLSFFDTAVNMGTTEATKVLQFAIGEKVDGLWGEYTAAGLKQAMNKPAELITNFTSRRQRVYEMMPGFKYFGDDWTRRTTEIGKESLRMAA